jgi:hypothetical protein
MKQNQSKQMYLLLMALAVTFAACKKDEDNNLGPEIVVGADVIGMTGQTINLSVSASDPDGDALAYTWKTIESPSGSVPVISNSSNSNATFTTPTAGFYRVEIVVEDGRGGQASGVISLSIGGVLPSSINSTTVLPDLFADSSIPDYYALSNMQIREGLTLSPGVVLEFGSDVLFWVNGNTGYLKAEGTPVNKIIFRGINKTKGSWRGIAITSTNISNSLNHLDILHAGSSNNGDRRAAIRVQSNASARLSIQNTSIMQTAGYALYVDGPDGILPEYVNNNFSNNDLAPVRVAADLLYSLDNQSLYAGNGVQAIEVAIAGNGTVRFSNNGTVKNTGLPYHFYSTAELMATVTFESGVTCLFSSGLRMNVNAVGAIIANGTSSNPVTFSGLNQVSGAWNGIEIASPSSQNISTILLFLWRKQRRQRRQYLYVWIQRWLPVNHNQQHHLKQSNLWNPKSRWSCYP